MDRTQLADRLFIVAEQRAARVGRRLGQGADQDLRRLTERGAEELLKTADRVERERQIVEAETNLQRLIDMAAEGAAALQGYPSDLLGEQSYFPAKLRFCPCRPFC
jgi:hypothetical protein